MHHPPKKSTQKQKSVSQKCWKHTHLYTWLFVAFSPVKKETPNKTETSLKWEKCSIFERKCYIIVSPVIEHLSSLDACQRGTNTVVCGQERKRRCAWFQRRTRDIDNRGSETAPGSRSHRLPSFLHLSPISGGKKAVLSGGYLTVVIVAAEKAEERWHRVGTRR